MEAWGSMGRGRVTWQRGGGAQPSGNLLVGPGRAGSWGLAQLHAPGMSVPGSPALGGDVDHPGLCPINRQGSEMPGCLAPEEGVANVVPCVREGASEGTEQAELRTRDK